jgi:hypothetical protein
MQKISPPVRIFALVAALAAIGAALMLFLGGPSTEVAATPVVQHKAAKTKLPSKTKAQPGATKKTAPASKPAPRKMAPSGFPPAVDAALAKHEVVVVSLVVPGARVDELAAAEARAGARLGGVGFLALNVLNEGVAHALLTKLGGLEDPSLLVLRRPGEVAVKLTGFVDRETVAQAAANASS